MTQNSEKATRVRGKPFAKGTTGNPGGRPAKTAEELDLIAACKTKAPEALQVIVHIMRYGELEKNRMAAAQSIIERGYGKAMQQVEQHVTGEMQVHWPLPRGVLDE